MVNSCKAYEYFQQQWTEIQTLTSEEGEKGVRQAKLDVQFDQKITDLNRLNLEVSAEF